MIQNTTSSAMTSRERWLAALNHESLDRLPFWPKLSGSYPPAQKGKFQQMSVPELHRYIGSDQHSGVPGFITEKHRKAEMRTDASDTRKVFTYETPAGETRAVNEFDTISQSWHPVEFPVKDLESLRVMKAFYEDTEIDLDKGRLNKAQEQARILREEEDAVTTSDLGESPLMHWVEWIAGIEQAHYLLMDYPEEVESLFAQMDRLLQRKTQIIAEYAPSDILYLTENTSTTLISPDQYRRYCYPHIMKYAQTVEDCGAKLVLHMCGTIKDILPDLATLPVTGFEAFTSPPVGNTRLVDGRTQCPDKCLIGGTNARMWTYPAHDIIAELEEDLASLPHHRGIVVTSAGVMPPLADPDTIRRVCEWVKQYPARF